MTELLERTQGCVPSSRALEGVNIGIHYDNIIKNSLIFTMEQQKRFSKIYGSIKRNEGDIAEHWMEVLTNRYARETYRSPEGKNFMYLAGYTGNLYAGEELFLADSSRVKKEDFFFRGFLWY